MKNKNFHYLLIFTIFLTVTSCATDPMLRTYVPGEWRPVKLGTLELQKVIPDGEVTVPQYNMEDEKTLQQMKESLTAKNPDGTMKKSGREEFDRLVAEANTTYIFRKEGFGGRMNPETPVKGSWKLKNKGARLIITDEKTKEKFVLVIDTLTSKRMIATNKYIPAGMMVTYLKVSDEAP